MEAIHPMNPPDPVPWNPSIRPPVAGAISGRTATGRATVALEGAVLGQL